MHTSRPQARAASREWLLPQLRKPGRMQAGGGAVMLIIHTLDERESQRLKFISMTHFDCGPLVTPGNNVRAAAAHMARPATPAMYTKHKPSGPARGRGRMHAHR